MTVARATLQLLLTWMALVAFSQADEVEVLKDGALLQWYTGLASTLYHAQKQLASAGNAQTDTHSVSQTNAQTDFETKVQTDAHSGAEAAGGDFSLDTITNYEYSKSEVLGESHASLENNAASTVTTTTATSPQAPNCGAVVDGSLAGAGVLTSPGYPDQYGQGLYCVWTIVGGKGKRVRLLFEDFEVTKTPSCSGDYLRVSVTGSSNDTHAVPLCGTDVPGEFLSDQDVIYIEFRSTPDGDTCRGFSARYSVEEVVVTCGQEVSFLEFDFENPEYPEQIANDSSHCQLTVSHDCEVPICQVRLDFVEMELQPPVYGNCDHDEFMVRANEPVPVLCGSNSGQHMYVDVAGRASTSLHVLLSPILPKPVGHVTDPDTGDTHPLEWRFEVEEKRRWKIRVNQIPCDCSYDHLKPQSPRAPTGCLQYHVGVREMISSFNFGGTKLDYDSCWNGTERDCGRQVWTGHLNNLDYHVCVRAAEGYCGIMYTPTGPESFLLNGETPFNTTELGKNLYGSKGCQADYVLVPKSRTPGDNDPWSHDRFCGQALGNYVKGPIVSYSTPFYMQVKTDEDEFSRSIDIGNRGFELQYTQLPCSGPYLFNGDQKFVG
ncbi:cubilin-like [Portunus trituberculatus]|nr:cubilin-like [Portunus trituberculatus]